MHLAGARVAVTGATGFLGRYIVDTLLARRAEVVGVVRDPDRVPALGDRIELRRADLADTDALTAAFTGADAVVANAALFSLRNQSWDDHVEANVDGTHHLFDALARLRLRRVVHISSVAVYRGHRERRVREDHPQYCAESPRKRTTVYPISKALSEQLAVRLAQEYDLDLTVIRPCGIYGAFDPNLTPLLRRLASWPVTLLPLGTHIPLVYAGDVAEAVALALERDRSVGRTYNVTGEDATLRQLVRDWHRAGGRRAWIRIPVPLPVSRLFDNARAERELGWRNRPYVDGFRDLLERERAAG